MLANGILETTTTTGTGNLTTSAVTGRPRFTDKFTANATEASASHFYYAILTQDSPPKLIEEGIGYMSATGTLVRSVPLMTYSSGTLVDTGSVSAISLSAGTYNVICTGEVGSAGGLSLPAIDNSVSASRYAYSSHIPSTQYGATLTMTANRLYFQPYLHTSTRPVDGLFFRHSSVAANFRMALFEVNKDGTAGRKIMGSTADLSGTTGAINVITTGGPVRIPPGWYYLAIVADAGAFINASSVNNMSTSMLGHDGVQYNFVYGYMANGSTTIADPASAITTKVTQASPAMGIGVRLVA